MGDLLGIGISGLKAQQTALSVTGHNITNAGTEGYSRQVVNFNENTPQFIGGVWTGSGVSVDSIKRVYDEFLTGQMQRDTSIFNEFDTLSLNASQIDSLLADSGTGIQPGIERMFGALQSVVDDPSSLPARQVLLSEANGLVDRFSSINDRLNDQSEIINGQMEVVAGQISTIGGAIAELNIQIQFALAASNGSPPNDMLDQRDKLVTDLAELVAVETVTQDGSAINVFIGNGQALVIGNESNEVFAQAGSTDPSRIGIYFRKGDSVQEVTAEIKGGQLGGMLEFREQVLEPTINGLGRVAMSINETFNDQHHLGIDFEGSKGGNFFTDINTPSNTYLRVQGDAGNKQPNDRLVSLHITDTSQLTVDNYRMEFPGPGDFIFKVYNDTTGEELATTALTGLLPQSLEIDGFEIRLEAGSFQAGDKFLITPTRSGASDIDMKITRGEEIAIASPISTDSAIGNRGSGAISQGSVYDINTPYLSSEGEMDPPLIIRFTSPTSYDVLDNSDPGNPIPLFPPLMNQTYVPGISNNILPPDEGKTGFTSFGGYLPTTATYQAPPPAAIVTAVNGFFPERITINRENPITGQQTSQPLLTTPANSSAKEIARLLSERDGVEASARTMVQLTNFTEDTNPLMGMGLVINGIEITDTLVGTQTKYASDYPEIVPDPVDANFIADRINANFDFQDMGIIAKSDGSTVTIIALNGEDISFDVTGDLGDSFEISNGDDIELTSTGEATFTNLSEFEGYDFSSGGPYTYDFDVPGQGSFSIELTGTHATGTDVLNEIQAKLQASGMSFAGNIDVALNEKGGISFQSRLQVSGTGPNGSNKIAMGGEVKVVLDENYSLEIDPPGNNLFDTNPVGEPVHFGFDLEIEGLVETGDNFTVKFNQDGTSDSRNGVALGDLQTKDAINGNSSYSGAYATLVEEVGSITSRAQINKESSQVLLRNSQDAVSSSSGVNLDEEAAALIRYELAYNASAKVIQVARDIFDTLINTF
ncbi:flagellar hook-associated protein FlgK [Oleispira antarctica]|uniref:Flagellar hook-associated protein 1 n=1 Tax=Oleispira antarctica TaxID=188908 RepID=A0A1Y5I061_OLEAN|nr:flagellar hook-associated protein FlgK [Oleispira antarctica]